MARPSNGILPLLKNTATIYLERVMGLCSTVSRPDVRMLCWTFYQIGYEEARMERIENIRLFQGMDDDEKV